AAALLVSAVALWFEPVQQTLMFGQVNLWLMLLVVWDVARPPAARAKGVLIGLAAGFKLTPGIFILYLLVTGRRRPAILAAITFAATVAISWILLPAESHRYWLDGALTVGNKVGIDYIANQSLRGVAVRLLGNGGAAAAL